MSFRLDGVMAATLKRLATEQGCAIGRLTRELIEEALRARTGRPAPRPFDPGDPDDDDDPLPDWGPAAEGCECHTHAPVVSGDPRLRHGEWQHCCPMHGGLGQACRRCVLLQHSSAAL